jgi:hypothetical protein
MGTYSQHVNFLYDKDDDRCPRLAFLEDLSREIERWIEAGEQVIVMLDANEDVRNGSVHRMFEAAGMCEVVIEINSELPATSTFSRNFQEIPIDSIFATSSICIKGGGYFAFGEGPGPDHRCLWVDLTYQIAFGHPSPPMGHRQARRLTCTDPRTRRRYTEMYCPFVQQHRLDMRSYCLQASITGSLSPSQVIEYEAISSLRSQGMEHATHCCRKFKMGGVEWNPDIQVLRNRITAWHLQLRKLRGCRVGSQYLSRVILSTDLPPGSLNVSLPSAVVAQRANFKAYRLAKKRSHLLP